MINKKVIIVIAIFIATGFLVFSFAATPQGESVDNNDNSMTNNTNDKNNSDNKNGTTSGTKDNDKDKKKDNDVTVTPIGSLDNQNNGQNITLDNNTNNGYVQDGNQTGGNAGGTQAGGNTGETQTGGNTGGTQAGGNAGETQTGGNTGGTQTGGNTGGTQAGGNTVGNQAGGNTGGDQAGGNTGGDQAGGNTGGDQAGGNNDKPEVNVDTLTGPSVFVSNDKKIAATVENGNVVTYEGVVEKSNVDDFGVYYVDVIVRAPYKYSQNVLRNASVVTPYGEKYNAGFLQYDSEGYAYFSIPQGFINGVSSELSLTINWGVGEDSAYTLKSNINVVD